VTYFDVACYARAHMDKAQGLKKSLPPNGYLPLLPCAYVSDYLAYLQSTQFDVFDPILLNTGRVSAQLTINNFWKTY